MSQHPVVRAIEDSYRKPAQQVSGFRPGDSVRVHTLIKEGDKERVQVFEGVVIDRKEGGSRASFTVRKISYGVGVERIFPLHSSRIEKIELTSRGRVRRARLNYLRGLEGKAARIKTDKDKTDKDKSERAVAAAADKAAAAEKAAAEKAAADKAAAAPAAVAS